MVKAENYYNDNIKNSNKEIELLNKSINIIGWLRLVVVICILSLSYYMYSKIGIFYAVLSLIVGLVVFIFMANYHNKKITRRDNLLFVFDFIEKGLKRINGE